MRFNNVYLKGIGSFLPTTYLSSEQIEDELTLVYEKLKLPKGRLELQTGVKRRGYYKDLNPSDISALSAQSIFEKTSYVNKSDIDLLINASVCRDYLEPSTASFVHKKLGLAPHCQSYDVSNACLGFLNALTIAASQIELGAIKHALITSGENSWGLWSETKNFLLSSSELTRKSIKKYIANLTIGSMGVAYLLSSEREGAMAKLLGSQSLSNTEHADLCKGDSSNSGLMMETESVELMQAGLKLAKENFELASSSLCLTKKNHGPSDFISHTVGHQVSMSHRAGLISSLELNPDRDYITYDQFGNTGSAAAPFTLEFHKDKFKVNDEVSLLGIGSGLHSTILKLKWH